MKKYSQKQTETNMMLNEAFETYASETKQDTKDTTPKENRFKGMSENIEIFEPLIIPGYKIRG